MCPDSPSSMPSVSASPSSMPSVSTNPPASLVLDFSDPNVDLTPLTFSRSAATTPEIQTGPSGLKAMRFNEDFEYGVLDIDINPNAMRSCTLVIAVNLVSILNNRGWVLTSDNGGFDRGIVLHDNRFNGMGMPSGAVRSVWRKKSKGKPRVGEWMHIAAVYSQGKPSYFYVDAAAAPLSVTPKNRAGLKQVYLGTHPSKPRSHQTDSWVNEVRIYDKALSADEILELYNAFRNKVDAASFTPSSNPSELPSEMPSFTASELPSISSKPSDIPSMSPSNLPSEIPSDVPSFGPSAMPSNIPSLSPSSTPSGVPSRPSEMPSSIPSSDPSMTPSDIPSQPPSNEPSSIPSLTPSNMPSQTPSHKPSSIPSLTPSNMPSQTPSHEPSSIPSLSPSNTPSQTSSHEPSSIPSLTPSNFPSQTPSNAPSSIPSHMPSQLPSEEPSFVPSHVPSQTSNAPSSTPSGMPSQLPSKEPSFVPSNNPSGVASSLPSAMPSNSAWIQIGADIDGEANDHNFGFSTVSLSNGGSIVAVGTPFHARKQGHVRVFEYDGSHWNQRGGDLDGVARNDRFGVSVSLSGDGQRVAIGAPEHQTHYGHVRVFEYNDHDRNWVQVGSELKGNSGDNIGRSVSLSDDGSLVAMGGETRSKSGVVRIFHDVAGTWTQMGTDLTGDVNGDKFGRSVSLSGNGSIVAVGAVHNNHNGNNAGHVKIFEYNNNPEHGTWQQRGSAILGAEPLDNSGGSVSLSYDGSVVAIGAQGRNSETGVDRGHARVYDYDSVGDVWNQVGADLNGQADEDRFGSSVSLSDDGSVLAVGGKMNDANGATNSGHVRVYKNEQGSWVQVGTAIDGQAAGDQTGQAVSLSADGTIVAVAAPVHDGKGNVRIFNFPP